MEQAGISKYDAVIIGGGPAGLSTALHLERIAPHLIPKTIIIEKERYPRPKLCGGGLTIDAEVLLERLGLDVNEIPYRLAISASMIYKGKGLELKPKKQHAIKIIQRYEFDHWLAIKARERGIHIQENTGVKNIHTENGKVIVETDKGIFHSQVVVGADGSNGITRNCILPDKKLRAARLLEIRLKEEPGSYPDNYPAVFDFTPISSGIAGYTWDFPAMKDGVLERCTGIFDNNMWVGKSKPALKDVLIDDLERNHHETRKVKVEGHPLRLFSSSKPIAVPGVLLAGDAAGSDPLFGEGISLALGYGRVAARTIKSAFDENDFEFENYRHDILFSSLGQTLLIRKIIARIIYSFDQDWFQKIIWQGLHPVVKLAGWFFVVNWAKRLK